MSTNAIALREQSEVTEVQRLGGLMAASGYFADAREMAQAAVKILAGRELGIPPVAAMMGISIIKGKVALGGNLIASRVRAHGYDYRHKQFDSKGCVLEFLSKPDGSGKRAVLGESSFTEEDAKAAQISSEMYRKFPRNMYFNRAMSNGARWYTPEVFAGAPVYCAEELGARVDEHGEVLQDAPAVQVADRKIAEMKGGKSYAEVSEAQIEEPAENVGDLLSIESFRACSTKDRIARFAALKSLIGDEAYYRILGAAGYEHCNQFPTLALAVRVFSEMVLEYQEMVQARGVV